jgi:hypothetical protein
MFNELKIELKEDIQKTKTKTKKPQQIPRGHRFKKT